ncbi:MAG TPA: PEP-CTERM sorting domain-containing protein [Gemmatimonadaceae bacterium]
MSSYSVRQVAGAVVAIGMLGGFAHAQAPTSRVPSQEHIPTKKDVPERAQSQLRIPTKKDVPEQPAAAAAPIVVPGKNMVVYAAPVVTRIVTSESGIPVVLVERAPTVGAPGVNWLPLLGLLGGAALIGTLGSHNGSGGDTAATAPVTPEVPTTPIPPVVPPVTPPTVVPEPATMALMATGLAGLAGVLRRRRQPA